MFGMDYIVLGVFFKGNMFFYDENKLKMFFVSLEVFYFIIIICVYCIMVL